MIQHLEEIRENQKKTWNKFSPGWKKWDQLTLRVGEPAGKEMIATLNLKGAERVLDIASGTGEPGLTIASMLDGGEVVLTDLAEGMLSITRENALLRGIGNIETVVCDGSDLPFGDNSFDAVSCRFGFMFFPDLHLGANEIFRVLRAGGRVAISVWNIPEKNFWVTAILDTIRNILDIPRPGPDEPGFFRCARPGLMEDIFARAGFRQIKIKEVSSRLDAGTVDVYWNLMTEVSPPVAAALNQADETMRKKIRDQVFKLVKEKFPREVVFETSALVISAQK